MDFPQVRLRLDERHPHCCACTNHRHHVCISRQGICLFLTLPRAGLCGGWCEQSIVWQNTEHLPIKVRRGRGCCRLASPAHTPVACRTSTFTTNSTASKQRKCRRFPFIYTPPIPDPSVNAHACRIYVCRRRRRRSRPKNLYQCHPLPRRGLYLIYLVTPSPTTAAPLIPLPSTTSIAPYRHTTAQSQKQTQRQRQSQSQEEGRRHPKGKKTRR